MMKPTSPVAPRATFPVSKNNAFNKLQQSIFDGFDEEEKGITYDTLSPPKTSAKKLTLNNLRNGSIPSPHHHSMSVSPSSRLKIIPDNGLKDSSHSDFDSTQVKCGVINTRSGYYIHPPIEQLDEMVDEAGNCFVRGLVIGRRGYGEIRFTDVVNIAGINLDDTVYFRHKEVVVYPDDSQKPPLGEGLNCPAEIRMERVWPIDKVKKGDPIKSLSELKSIGYEDTLRRSCHRLGAEFLSYLAEFGEWTFLVKHFSKYSCEPEESEDGAKADTDTALSMKGLGGISMNQLQNNFPQGARNDAAGSLADVVPGQRQEPESLNLDFSPRRNNQPSDFEDPNPDASFPPVFRRRISTQQSTPQVPSVADDLDLGYGDVEHNPLTPSESNDSELEWQLASGKSFSTDYESVLKDKQESGRVRMMKSVMLMDVDETCGGNGDFQPPIKRSRQPLSRRSDSGSKTEEHEKFTHGPRRPARSLKQIQSGSTGPSLVVIQELEEYHKNSNAMGPGYLASIKKRSEICLTSVPVEESPFCRLISGPSNGCRIRTVPRVCFGPMGFFVTTTNSITDNQRVIKINRIASYMEKAAPTLSSRLYMKTVDGQMNLELNGRGGFIADEVALLQSIINSVPAEIVAHDGQKLKDELMMWELCEILWPLKETNEMLVRDKGFLVKQRKELSRWFKKYCSDLFGEPSTDANDKTILGLMKKGRRREACELAVNMENYTLANCLAQKVRAKKIHGDCGQQLEVWEDEGAFKFLPSDMISIYRLCCGKSIFDKAELSNMSTSQWLQHFALHVWYSCPVHLPVDKVVMSFQSYLKSTADSSEKLSFPVSGESSIPNLCVQLLKLYSFSGYPIRNVLDPRTSNPDCLEYKLSWLLMVNLSKFGYLADSELHGSITTSYAGNLEQIGLYKWVPYVMSSLSRTIARDNFIETILEKNIGFWGDKEDETFLQTFLSPTAIFSSKVLRAAAEGRKDRLIWFLLKSHQYDRAYYEFIRTLSVDSMVSGRNMQSMLKILECIEPFSSQLDGWDTLGGFLLSFLKIQIAKNSSVTNSADFPSGIESVVTSFISAVGRLPPRNENDSALLLELILSAQKIMEVLMVSHPKLMDGDVEWISNLTSLPIPREYMVELEPFLNHHLG